MSLHFVISFLHRKIRLIGHRYQSRPALLRIGRSFVIEVATMWIVNRMKPYSRKHLLTGLLALVLLGVVACGVSQPDGEAPNVSIQPGSPPAGEIPQPSDAAPVESADSYSCTDSNPHPIGESIAATYEVSYQQVMTWFCSGYSFENILIALETSEAVDVPADMLLQMLLEKEWEEIWREVGFIE